VQLSGSVILISIFLIRFFDAALTQVRAESYLLLTFHPWPGAGLVIDIGRDLTQQSGSSGFCAPTKSYPFLAGIGMEK